MVWNTNEGRYHWVAVRPGNYRRRARGHDCDSLINFSMFSKRLSISCASEVDQRDYMPGLNGNVPCFWARTEGQY